MIELHLIGYTADLEHVVLDVDPQRDRGEYKLVIDADLFATLEEIRVGRRAAGMETGDDGDEAVGEEANVGEPVVEEPVDEEPAVEEPVAEEPAVEEAVVAEPVAEEPVAEAPVAEEPEVDQAPRVDPLPGEPRPQRDAKLSPAQIQDLLRRGRSVRSVARAAGTDREWIERWLPPIEAERRRILEAAWSRRLERPRLGRSRESLREAVERSLRERRVRPEDATWAASRRANGTWSVAVRFTHRGRDRTATWTYDPVEGQLAAASESARELGFTRPRSRRGR